MLAVAVGEDKTSHQSAPASGDIPSPSDLPCVQDWHKCRDNAAFANLNGWFEHAQRDCKAAADVSAKFGAPIWPEKPFEDIERGTSVPKAGTLVAIERDAQFENGFGARENVQVRCSYDLNRWQVTQITTSSR